MSEMIKTTDTGKIQLLKNIYELNGAEWKDYNLGGIRNEEHTGDWNDVLWAATDNIILLSQGTTDPGWNAIREHRVGADFMQLGPQTGLWKLGNHGGTKWYHHEAFVQVGAVSTIRDTDRNGIITPDDLIVSNKMNWGMNRHSVVGPVPSSIGNWSWGCQVILIMAEHIAHINLAKEVYGRREAYNILYDNLLVLLEEDTREFYFLTEAA